MRLPINGIELNAEVAGAGHPLLLLHGFTGSTATWASLLPVFSEGRRTVAVDVIGHGRSDAPLDPERYRMERCVEDLLAILDGLEVGRTDMLGYSMGGRIALQLAAGAPERVRALILESGSPGLADPAERRARVAADNALAENIDRDGLTAFIDSWERVPLFASQAKLPAEARARLRAQRLRSNPAGLANSLRGMGTGRQTSLWDRLAMLTVPTLLIGGDLDDKYCDIARQMGEALPDAQVRIVDNAGHATHLEQPAVFAEAVLGFLQAQRPAQAESLRNR